MDNPIQRRVALLTDALKSRMDQVRTQIVEPKPYGMVRVSEGDQVRKYLDMRDTGQLPALRERMGDQATDQYVKEMSARAAKYLGTLEERKIENAKTPTTGDLQRFGDPVATFYTADDNLESF